MNMIELTLLNGDTFSIDPETINVFKAEKTGSEIETTSGEKYHVKESILEIMQEIINFRCGVNK